MKGRRRNCSKNWGWHRKRRSLHYGVRAPSSTVVVACAVAPLVSSVWVDRHRRTTSRRDGPVVDPLPSDAVGSVHEFSTWRSPVLHDHHDPGIETSLGMIDVG